MNNIVPFGLSYSPACVARLFDLNGQIWNGSAFEAYDSDPENLATYVLAATELGTGSGVFVATVPVVSAGGYEMQLVIGDGLSEPTTQIARAGFDWDGSSIVSLTLAKQVLDILEADHYIKTSTTPWQLVLIKKGSGTLSTGTVLLTQSLKTEAGVNVTSIETFVGQQVG